MQTSTIPTDMPLASLTRPQLRALKVGDRVSRIAARAVVETAPVVHVTATQIVVLWPDGTRARYWCETGRRLGAQHEILRMPEPVLSVEDAEEQRELAARLPLFQSSVFA